MTISMFLSTSSFSFGFCLCTVPPLLPAGVFYENLGHVFSMYVLLLDDTDLLWCLIICMHNNRFLPFSEHLELACEPKNRRENKQVIANDASV